MAYATVNNSWKRTIKELVIILLAIFLIRTFVFGLYIVPTGSMETTMLVGERFFADKFTVLFSKPTRGTIISLNDPTYSYAESSLKRLFQEYVYGPVNVTKRVIGIPGDHVRGTIEDGKPVVYLNGKKLDESYLNKYPLLISFDPEVGDVHLSSYVPSKPYTEQPYYDINPDLVLRDASVPAEGIAQLRSYFGPVTAGADGALLLEPAQPIAEQDQAAVALPSEDYWTGTDLFDVHLGQNQYWLMGDNRRGSKDCRAFGPVDGRLIHGRIVFRIWSIDSRSGWWIVDLIKHPIAFWSKVRWSRCLKSVH